MTITKPVFVVATIVFGIMLTGFHSIILIAQDNKISWPSIKFHHLNKELSNNQITSIFQDRYGYIWIGTLSGLHRYDGDNFEVFFTSVDTTSLPDSRIESIYEDKKGNLWIGTYDGICLYNRNRNNFIRFKTNDDHVRVLDPNTERIREIVEDSDGMLWMASQRSGLYYFDSQSRTFKHFFETNEKDILGTTHINALCPAKDGVMWIGTLDDGVKRLDTRKKTVEHFRHDPTDPNSLADDYIASIVVDRKENVWIGTNFRGVDRLVNDSSKAKFIHYVHKTNDPNTLGNNDVRMLYVDSQDHVWACNENGGLNLYSSINDAFFSYKSDPNDKFSVHSTSYWCIYEDHQGRLWLGSSLDGIDVVDKYLLKFDLFSKSPGNPNSITNNIVRSFYEDKDGNLWIATDGGGLNFYDTKNDKFKSFEFDPLDPKSIRSNAVLSMCEDNDGYLWIATWQGGINILDRSTMTFKEFDSKSKFIRSVYNLIKDSHGNIWIGTYEGVSKFDWKTKSLTTFRHDPGNPNTICSNTVPVLFEDSDKNIWIGTEDGGLNYLPHDKTDEGIFKRFTPKPGDTTSIPSKLVNHIFEDSKRNIWVATGGGLCRFIKESETFKTFTTRDGLASNHIKSIIECDEGKLWIGTAVGLSQFDPSSNTFKNYDKRDGLQPGEFSRYSVYKTKKGELLFGGINGFNRFMPSQIGVNPIVPPVYITGLKIFNKPVTNKNENSILSKPISELYELKLSHKQSVFTLEFIALNYTNPEKNQYAYRLEGLENQWNYVGSQRSATYTNLDHGEYVFHVKASNNDGQWNEEGKRLRIIITPPFWKTTWFRLLGIASLIGLIYLVIYMRTQQFKRKNSQLEEKVKERTARLNEVVKELQIKQDEIETTNEELTSALEDLYQQKNQTDVANEKLKETYAELMTINNQLDERVHERTSKLVKANQELDRFVYSASHDLSAPLKSILGLIQLTKVENKNELLFQHLKHMERSVLKLEDVIKSLTQFSRNMGYSVTKQEFKFYEIMDEVLDELKYPFQSGSTRIIKNYSPDDCLKSDYLRVKIVLSNLISNALKYKGEGETDSFVEISFSRSNGSAIIQVKDNGIGIKKENLSKIFEMFYRGTSRSNGSGLGLYIVKETLDKLGGTVSVESDPGHYTLFTITIHG